MKLLKITLVLAGLAVSAALLFAQADTTLQKAIRKETVEGDLKGAIGLYQKAISQAGKDRATAARAMVGLGECYEKQGSTDARKTYEQVLSKFGDQKDAVEQARARLAAMGGGQTGQQTTRLVWTGSKVNTDGSVSPDGRYISFTDWEQQGNLALHDLISGTDRLLTNNAVDNKKDSVFAEESVISRDGKQVAFNWYDFRNDRYELRLADLTGDANPRRLFDSAEFSFLEPVDWSPDGKLIALHLSYPRATNSTAGQLGLVSVGNGSLRVLNITGRPFDARFSLDGKYLAYDRTATPMPQDNKRGVYILRLDSGVETQVVSNAEKNSMTSWSPDGKQLLFASGGDLWSMPVADGKPQAQPVLIAKGLDGDPMGITTAGALYIGQFTNASEIRIASVDLSTGKRLAAPVPLFSAFEGQNGQQAWSRDGKYLAYCSSHTGAVPVQFMAIRPAERGDVRDFRLPDSCGSPNWAPDGRSIAYTGKNGLSRIDVQTGAVTPLLSGLPAGFSYGFPQFSPDGKKIYYMNSAVGQPPNTAGGTQGGSLVERDLASGNERQIPGAAGFLSPDGRYLVRNGGTDAATGSIGVELVPTDGGEPRVAFGRLTANPGWGWTPDSQALVLWKNSAVAEGPVEAWLYPIDGGPPHQLDIDTAGVPTSGPRPIRVNPDGRQIAYQAVTRKSEVLVLENFLPAAKAAPAK